MAGIAHTMRVGQGYDVHALVEGRPLIIGGVTIPYDKGLAGHSDADVLLHAVTDAVLGAAGLGDIGRHFPDTDAQWKGADSRIFLEHAMGRVAARGFKLSNCDVTLICEYPKVGPHAPAMRAALAAIMNVPVDRISVKATTSEKLGFTGRGEGIAAIATATLVSA